MSDKPRCCKLVSDGGSWPSYHACSRAGVVERDGKLYCKQHDPEAVKARNEARAAKWRAEWDAERAEREMEGLRKSACKGCTREQLQRAIELGGLNALLEADHVAK